MTRIRLGDAEFLRGRLRELRVMISHCDQPRIRHTLSEILRIDSPHPPNADQPNA
jgi:hypothetical protein